MNSMQLNASADAAQSTTQAQTQAEFIAFAKAKPADEKYDFGSMTQCPVAQFSGRSLWSDAVPYKYFQLHTYNGAALAAKPETWGALVQRLEAGQ